MGIIGYVTAKILGLATPDEYLKKNLALFCNINNLQNLEKEHCYKMDKSPYHPSQSLWLQVHFCTAIYQGKTVAVVIQYDEDTGFTCGSLIDLKSSLRHGLLARSYRNGVRNGTDFYSHVLQGVDETKSLKNTSEQD